MANAIILKNLRLPWSADDAMAVVKVKVLCLDAAKRIEELELENNTLTIQVERYRVKRHEETYDELTKETY